MNTPPGSESLIKLQQEQTRLRIWLAALLIAAVCVFALSISWLGRESPVRPLLSVKASLFLLLSVYAVAVGISWVYARWIKVRREPAVRDSIAKNNKQDG